MARMMEKVFFENLRRRSLLCRRVDPVVADVGQLEPPAIRGHAQQQLTPLSAQAQPVGHREVHIHVVALMNAFETYRYSERMYLSYLSMPGRLLLASHTLENYDRYMNDWGTWQ